MPKLPINHANTQIYRFVCNDVNITNTYVGSTTNWSHRKTSHKKCCIDPSNRVHHLKVYQVIRANGGWDNWTMILVEDYPCNGKREAEQREQYWKEHYNDNMGMNKAFITEEQHAEQHAQYRATHKDQIADYRVTHRDQIAEQQAQYRATHRDQIAEQYAQYRATHRDQILEQTAQYRATHKDQILEQHAQYRATHRDQINIKRRQAYALKKLKI